MVNTPWRDFLTLVVSSKLLYNCESKHSNQQPALNSIADQMLYLNGIEISVNFSMYKLMQEGL